MALKKYYPSRTTLEPNTIYLTGCEFCSPTSLLEIGGANACRKSPYTSGADEQNGQGSCPCRRTCCHRVPRIVLTVAESPPVLGLPHGEGEQRVHAGKRATRSPSVRWQINGCRAQGVLQRSEERTQRCRREDR